MKSRSQREWRSRKEQQQEQQRFFSQQSSGAGCLLSLLVSNLELIGSREIRSFYIIREPSVARPATSAAHPGGTLAVRGSSGDSSGACLGPTRAHPAQSVAHPAQSGPFRDSSGASPGLSGAIRGSSRAIQRSSGVIQVSREYPG